MQFSLLNTSLGCQTRRHNVQSGNSCYFEQPTVLIGEKQAGILSKSKNVQVLLAGNNLNSLIFFNNCNLEVFSQGASEFKVEAGTRKSIDDTSTNYELAVGEFAM